MQLALIGSYNEQPLAVMWRRKSCVFYKKENSLSIRVTIIPAKLLLKFDKYLQD